jgi:hypothetical protein
MRKLGTLRLPMDGGGSPAPGPPTIFVDGRPRGAGSGAPPGGAFDCGRAVLDGRFGCPGPRPPLLLALDPDRLLWPSPDRGLPTTARPTRWEAPPCSCTAHTLGTT